MPETLVVNENLSKKEKYLELIPQIESLIENETNVYANLANISAALYSTFKWWWVGFYLVDQTKNTELVLGPFQVKNCFYLFIFILYNSNKIKLESYI